MRKHVILAARTESDDPSAGARGHVEAQEAIDLVDRLAASLMTDGRVSVDVVPHVLGVTDRILWVNERFPTRESGFALEIHKGKGPRGTSGVEAWVATGDRLGRLVTAAILRELSQTAGLPDRGVKEALGDGQPGERWLRRIRPVAGLLACGFMGADHFDNARYALGLHRGLVAALGVLERRDGATRLRVRG